MKDKQFVIDDHLLLRILLDEEPPGLRPDGGRLFTTGLWYHRLCRSVGDRSVVGMFFGALGRVGSTSCPSKLSRPPSTSKQIPVLRSPTTTPNSWRPPRPTPSLFAWLVDGPPASDQRIPRLIYWLSHGERRLAMESRGRAYGLLITWLRRLRRTPQVVVNDWPGSRRVKPWPVWKALGGQVIGSVPSPERRRLGLRVSRV